MYFALANSRTHNWYPDTSNMSASQNTWIIAIIASSFIVVCLSIILIDIILVRRKLKLVQDRNSEDDTYAEEDDDNSVPSVDNLSVDLGCEKDGSTTSTSEST